MLFIKPVATANGAKVLPTRRHYVNVIPWQPPDPLSMGIEHELSALKRNPASTGIEKVLDRACHLCFLLFRVKFF